MADIYKHGTRGEAIDSSYPVEEDIATLPVYIGSLPVHRFNETGAKDFDYSPYVNEPILISNYKQALELYSEDWQNYTLCEALFVHFMNGRRVVAPIVVVNVLDPAAAKEAESTTASIIMNKEGKSFVGYIEDALCNIDTLAITADGVQFAEGEISYAYAGDSVKIVITKADFTATSVTATYTKVKFNASTVRAEDFQKAADAIDYVEMKLGMIPTISVAPAFSEKPEFHDILVQKCIDHAAYKWELIHISDIPATSDVNTRAKAIQWKKDNNYNSQYEKPCYPMVGYEDKVIHLSTVTAFTMQETDMDNDNVPSETPSNKTVDAARTCLADGKTVFWLEWENNELNAAGITTTNLVKQTLRLWGPHMGNFNQATIGSIKPEHKFDSQIRMRGYILNYLQYNYYDEVDENFTPKDIDAMKNSIQTWLDSLVADGKLLFAKVHFDKASNPDSELENGNIIFDIEVTYGVVAKSITFRVKYTRTGLSLLFGGEE